MASREKTSTSCEVDEEEYEDYEEMEIEEEVEDEDYEEAFEEEEEEIEQNEEVEDDEKKVVEVQDYEEAFEEEEEEEEVEIEQNEEEDEDEKKAAKVQDYEEAFEEEEEEMEQYEEEEEEDGKKVVKAQKVQEEVEDSVQDTAREEEKSANPEQPPEAEGNTLPPPAVLPPLLQSVSDLEKIHCALSKFLHQWNSLNCSLDSITAAIDAHGLYLHDVRSTEQEKDEHSEQQEEKDDLSEQGKEKDERNEQEKEKDERSSVVIFCEKMDGKALLKYLESNSADNHRLRHEVPEALRRLPNPEKLVFDAIGKFYAQRRSAYNNNVPLDSFRRASVLLLELFVISGRPTGDSSVKGEADLGALLWWKRLVNENIQIASRVDSLGFILFLASFGISKDICLKDIGILLLKSNLKKNIDLFRRSSILVEKIPGVVKDLIRGEMYFEAAELSCCFGLTDTFPPLPLLSSFVAKVIKTGNLERHKSQGEPKLAKQATFRELRSLRSAVKCTEDHNLDIHKLSDSVNIRQKISDLENFVKMAEMKLKKKLPKRKAQHHVAENKSKKSKESFPSASEASQNASPSQPLLPGSEAEKSALSVAVKDHSYGRERKYYERSTSYRSSAMDYPSAQQFHQPQAASVYGNGVGVSGRNLYQFADTVIQHEEQLRKRSRSSTISPAGSKFVHH